MTEPLASLPSQIFAAFLDRLQVDETIDVSLRDALGPFIAAGALTDRKQIVQAVTVAATNSALRDP